MKQYSQPEKIDLLKTVYNQVHNSRRDKEGLERKMTFAVSAIFFGLASLIIKGSFNIPEGAEWKMLVAILTATGLAITVLIINAKTIQKWCQMIVRIEQIFGLYDSTIYINKDKVKSFRKKPYEEDTVFPVEVMDWGDGGHLQSIHMHVFVVVLSSLVVMGSVYF